MFDFLLKFGDKHHQFYILSCEDHSMNVAHTHVALARRENLKIVAGSSLICHYYLSHRHHLQQTSVSDCI